MGQHSGQPQEKSKSVHDSATGTTINKLVQPTASDQNASQQMSHPLGKTSSQMVEAQNHFQQVLYPTRNSTSVGQEQANAGCTSIFDLVEQEDDRLHKKQRYLPMSFQPSHTSVLKEQEVLTGKAPVKKDSGTLVSKPGMCALRLANYTRQMQLRPQDNNIEFWRSFVAEFFLPDVKKRLCVSSYGRKPDGVVDKGEWICNLCKVTPGHGFDITTEILPRLFKVKYENGAIKEHYHLEMPIEHKYSSNQTVLQCEKVTHETVFQQLRVYHVGRLRVAFSPDLKICSWDFCVQHHDELIPRKELLPLVNELGLISKKYHDAKKNSALPAQEIEASSSEKFSNSVSQLTKALQPIVNELGYEKRYMRHLQTSEIISSMKDIVDYSSKFGTGPIESMAKFTHSFNTRNHYSAQQQQQPLANDQSSAPAASLHLSALSKDHAKNPTNQLLSAGQSTIKAPQTSPFFSMAPSSSKVPHHTDTSSLGGESSLAILQDYLRKNPNLGKDASFKGAGDAENMGFSSPSASGVGSSRSNVQQEDDFEQRLMSFFDGKFASSKGFQSN
nr:transcriptional corepressor SEUSS-like [Coffea arabica]